MPELPPTPVIPAQDFFFGLVSAGLLLWTLMFLARSRILDRSLNEGSDDDLFYTLLRRPESAQLSFLISLFGHVFAFALLPWADAALPMKFRMHFDRYDTVVVQFRLDEKQSLKMPADLAEALPPSHTDNLPPDDAEDGDENDPGIGNGIEAPRLETDPGGRGEDIAPRREVRFQVEAQETPAPREVEIAAPEAPSINDPGLTSFELAWVPEFPHPEAIPAPGLPVEGPAADAELASADGVPTDLALQTDAGGPASIAENAEAPGIGREGQGYGWLIGADGGAGERLGGQGLRDLLAGLQRIGTGAGRGAGNGFGDGADDGASGEGGTGYGSGFAGDQPVPRKLHGIILISNDLQSLPEADGVLSGNPVYTVYVEVPGYSKKWILQVCVPRESGGEVELEGGGVLRVLSRKALDPPYAVHRVAPELHMEDEDPLYAPPRIVVYFRVTEEGKLLDQRIVAGVNEQTDNSVLASLQDWEFHPAFHNGEPVAVEALFGIPLR